MYSRFQSYATFWREMNFCWVDNFDHGNFQFISNKRNLLINDFSSIVPHRQPPTHNKTPSITRIQPLDGSELIIHLISRYYAVQYTTEIPWETCSADSEYCNKINILFPVVLVKLISLLLRVICPTLFSLGNARKLRAHFHQKHRPIVDKAKWVFELASEMEFIKILQTSSGGWKGSK